MVICCISIVPKSVNSIKSTFFPSPTNTLIPNENIDLQKFVFKKYDLENFIKFDEIHDGLPKYKYLRSEDILRISNFGDDVGNPIKVTTQELYNQNISEYIGYLIIALYESNSEALDSYLHYFSNGEKVYYLGDKGSVDRGGAYRNGAVSFVRCNIVMYIYYFGKPSDVIIIYGKELDERLFGKLCRW